MTRSMTGFGHYEVTTNDCKIAIEIKSVNHRYCDISIKIPKKLSIFENILRTQVKKYATRGKVDVFINYEDYIEGKAGVSYNKDIAASYIEGMKQMSHDFCMENTINTYQLACFPEVFKLDEKKLDEERIEETIVNVMDEAGKRFLINRQEEGERLRADIISKLEGVIEFINVIEAKSPGILKAHQDKLMDKVKELLGDKNIDESVLVSEMIVFADKICIDEEAVRLRSHVTNMKDTLCEKESVGRKLDFIAQEMNREANTILSKANDLEVSNHAINLKTEIEKIREQIQNIE